MDFNFAICEIKKYTDVLSSFTNIHFLQIADITSYSLLVILLILLRKEVTGWYVLNNYITTRKVQSIITFCLG